MGTAPTRNKTSREEPRGRDNKGEGKGESKAVGRLEKVMTPWPSFSNDRVRHAGSNLASCKGVTSMPWIKG